VEISDASSFGTACAVLLTKADFHPSCAGDAPPVFSAYTDVFTITPKAGTDGHLDAWSHGVQTVSIDLSRDPGGGKVLWLSGTDTGHTYFVYLENVITNAILPKFYLIDVFYDDLCKDQRPDSMKGAGDGTRDGVSQEGNTTGGPEHHP
jgi:hypothetical protein